MTATLADLLHLVDRAEKGTLLAEEALQLRKGLREWAAALEQARRTTGGLSAEVRRLRGQVAVESPRDSRSNPSRPEAAPGGPSRCPEATERPSPASSP